MTKLKEMLARKGKTQAQLARATGIDDYRISRYALGNAHHNEKTLARLAQALGCKPAELQEVVQ